jgi:hypothetical protein
MPTGVSLSRHRAANAKELLARYNIQVAPGPGTAFFFASFKPDARYWSWEPKAWPAVFFGSHGYWLCKSEDEFLRHQQIQPNKAGQVGIVGGGLPSLPGYQLYPDGMTYLPCQKGGPSRRKRRLPKHHAVGKPLKTRNDNDITYRTRAQVRTMRQKHQTIINLLYEYVANHFRVVENRRSYDALLFEYRPGRRLLIEVKSDLGLRSIHTAYGQLAWYKDMQFSTRDRERIDLAVLLPHRPNAKIRRFFENRGILVLWVRGKAICGLEEFVLA